MITGIFKITFDKDTFSDNFKSNPEYNIDLPNVLLVKLFKDCIATEVDNEIAIHKKIDLQTSMMPISPSILFYDTITPEFHALCKEEALQKYKKFCNIIKSTVRTPLSDRVHKILIMEFIECQTYKKFHLGFISDYGTYLMKINGVRNNILDAFMEKFKKLTPKFNILGKDIELNLVELKSFFRIF